MTTNEKAKAYDEAIDKIADVVEAGTIEQGLAEWLFPELKKSGDERIRKALITYFSDEDESYDGIPYTDILAWLEKQAEKGIKGNEGEIPNSEQNLADITDKLKEEYQKGWDAAMQQLPKEVDSQIWQIANNSAKTWEESFAILCATQKAYGKGKKDALKEQNIVVIIPKFRVGDEIKTSNEESLTITKIDEKGYWSEGLFICSFDDADKWELVEQKTTWSKEDERYLSYAIHAVEDMLGDNGKNIVAWLKSLRPQNGWKPSGDQIKALEMAVEGNIPQPGIIQSILEQLKKLITKE